MNPSKQKQSGPAPQDGNPAACLKLTLLVLAAAVLVTFWPVLGCGFLDLDDPQYVTSNPHVQGGLTWRGLWWALTAFHSSNWHPLTWLSHMLDVELFARSAAGPHLINLLLHACNTLLLFTLLRGLTGAHWRSAMVAGLFALHPLRVESVAWIAERKDVLSAFFGLLALWAYAAYAQSKGLQDHGLQDHGPQDRRPLRTGLANSGFNVRRTMFHPSSHTLYLLSLVLFALGLMSKPMLVTLPCVMLLLDYWPLQRFVAPDWPVLRGLIKEKAWFFLLAAASSAVTFLAQRQGGSVQPLAAYSITGRVENAVVSYGRYVLKTFWPFDLAMPYPHPDHWGLAAAGLATAMVAGGVCVAVLLRRKLPFLAVGTFWFIGMLVPVIGLVQVGGQSMADRYTYLPQIGLWMAVVWSAAAFASRRQLPKAMTVAAAGLSLVVCALLTRSQLQYWKDTETLLRHAIAVTKANDLAYFALGSHFDNLGRIDDAIASYRKALEIYPNFIHAHNNLADDLIGQGNFEEAFAHYREVVRLDPKFAPARNNYAAALVRQQRFDEAIELYTQALRLEPDYADAHYNLALVLATQRRFNEAIPHYQAAARKNPKAITYNNLGYALAALGRVSEAIEAYRRAIQLDPKLAQAYANLGNALARENQLAQAVENYHLALGLDPNNPAILNNLGHALAARQQYAEAITNYEAALRAEPGFALARYNLGAALVEAGRPELAVAEFKRVLAGDSANPQVHYQLARALASAGSREEATAEAREALRLKPGYAEAQELLRALGVEVR